MKFSFPRVVQVCLVTAVLQTAMDIVRSGSFYVIPGGIYFITQVFFFFITVSVAAFIATRIPSTMNLTQRASFFGVMITPLIFSYFIFYQSVSYYEQRGSLLVQDHHLTSAGMSNFAVSFAISGIIGVIGTLIYFRKHPRSEAQQA